MGTPWAPWPLLWAVLQLGWRPAWLLETPDRPRGPLTFSPAQLTVAEGETATFTCSFSNTSEHFVLNWYRVSPSNQTDKLAAFPEDSGQARRDPRFRVTWPTNKRDFKMSILAAQRNDSGTYLCGVIYLPPETQIHESPHAELTVTERALERPTESPSPTARPPGKLQGVVIGVTSVLVGVLLLLLLTWVLTTTFPGATRGSRSGHTRPQPRKEDASPGPVSVDYEELDFQWQEKTPEPSVPSVPHETEYATIVFPGRPGSPSRRASADSPPGPWPPRLEDGRSSWPL
ncbi:programmed cell death protein 1 isoform X2 [Pteronotus mesoamericanus]|uniref:programmed cell death protein 1 isoform X2 n=1 Tax=Pteronotus mesoamericanus TaxID=1884717 RepID=UPI0023ED4870|nr:programmed cell death protein 1 isoform X2 [Pteronotus parnellii mesoamericanus]